MASRTALISGSNSGIGAAIARELSSRGVNIVLNYPFPNLKDDCESVGKTLQTDWIAVEADLSTTKGPIELVAAAVSRFGHIDVVVHNAARFPTGPSWDVTVEDWDAAFALNVRGTMFLNNAALPHLAPYRPLPRDKQPITGRPGGSRIIVIGSGSSRSPQHDAFAYMATKGALESMVKGWALELPSKYGCTVNGVWPGPTYTELMKKLATPEILRATFADRTPVEGCMAEPEDVATAVAFLAEPSTKWINGEIIMVNGGFIMI
ncbi:3-oxoacyl-(Acyl-carrier protein) reductase [Pleurostoma richardsiae]|uniref:3-oxoacyl-(Acyl-carrier protein) reductase n=1 Tax=Pleurostoma richardsiae TaxID=41990 RepID=A0AA38VGP6_9PEZI|nr:3-oxoacyl-(Acyl-carrier protein) reductase [Pleurostoma richardsiae]